jgi:hypothetical protein
MKKSALILLMSLALCAPAGARSHSYNVLLAGGSNSNSIRIWLTPDGRSYVIDSIVPLEVGGSLCSNPSGNPNELVCEAAPIASFEVNADGGDDSISVSRAISIPVTMRGGTGRDTLIGGSGPDRLIGGQGSDRLLGRAGSDSLYGGPGHDTLIGGPGDDTLIGGPGRDSLAGGPGSNQVQQ